MSKTPLGIRVATLRRCQGLTQKQLATLAGVSTIYIKHIEAGQINPEFKLMNVAKVLGKPVEELYGH